MDEGVSRSEPVIRILAVAGAVVVSSVLFLGLGGFGFRLLTAARSTPKPATAESAQGVAAAPLPAVTDGAVPLAATLPGKPAMPPVSPEVQKLLEVGKGVFMQCAACHGPDGKAPVSGMAPHLAGSAIANGPSERMAALVLNGVLPEGRFQGVMVPWKAMLTDEQIAGVMTYVRTQFGNKGSPVTPGMVAHARAKYAGQTNPLKRSEVEAINADLPPG